MTNSLSSSEQPDSSTSSERVLCVDLDGTVIKTDLFHESFSQLVKHHPFKLLLVPFWLLRGRAYCKRKISELVSLRPDLLPYHEPVLEFLRIERERGRRIVLATASDAPLAQAVADHLGLFSEVLASDGVRNLTGHTKRQVLDERYGHKGYDYAGDRGVDRQVWRGSCEAVVVSSPRFIERIKGEFKVHRAFPHQRNSVKALVKALRIHQWVKNLLIFVPLVMAHRIADPALALGASTAFLAFSLCASSVYLLNDLLDLEADRYHTAKRHRPFASGAFSILAGWLLIPIFLVCGGLLASLLPAKFILTLALYYGLTLAYSFWLKQIALVDIILLASLYTLRILAGGYAVDVMVSKWLLAFSLFFFLSLACGKRYSELRAVRNRNEQNVLGRGYVATDLEQISQFGSASGYLSILVLALYISSREVTVFYSHPEFLWLLCPVLLYWISRIWLLAHRGELHEDPIVFAIRDRVSYLAGAFCGAIMLFAL